MAQSSISDLCSICYTEIPKYRCPRCKTQTCSLPCYKRHQQRASCSGKRDPAAYLKKFQLATPASIDRDYNYLKSVERSIDDASVDARERGVGVQHHRKDPQNHGFRRQDGFQRYLGNNGITVEHAPKGMSRQKANQSRVTKNDKIFWTIEWRDASGEQDLRHNAEDTSTLRELNRGVQNAKRKRKITSDAVDGNTGAASKKLRRTSKGAPAPAADAAHADHGEGDEAEVEAELPGVDVTASLQPQPEARQQTENHFYLLKPSTGSGAQVLIPLDPTTTLTKALQGQTVQEYPTIYVLDQPPDGLPEGFMHVDEYRATLRSGIKPWRSRAKSTEAGLSATRSEHAKDTSGGAELDAKAILAMLRRDARA